MPVAAGPRRGCAVLGTVAQSSAQGSSSDKTKIRAGLPHFRAWRYSSSVRGSESGLSFSGMLNSPASKPASTRLRSLRGPELGCAYRRTQCGEHLEHPANPELRAGQPACGPERPARFGLLALHNWQPPRSVLLQAAMVSGEVAAARIGERRPGEDAPPGNLASRGQSQLLR